MELNKCSRCGAFHVNSGDVCPRCANKDNLELSTFKSYIEQNGFSTVDTVSTATGIAQKNVYRFLGYEGISNSGDEKSQNLAGTGITFN